MPQLDANQLSVLQSLGLLISAVVWLATAACTVRYFYLFFARTSEFAALPHDYVIHHALRQGAGQRSAHALALTAGAFVGTLCCLFYSAAAALSWVPRGWTLFGEDLWVGYIAAALLALVATSTIHSAMIRLARRYADLERRP